MRNLLIMPQKMKYNNVLQGKSRNRRWQSSKGILKSSKDKLKSINKG